jgi:hypothetical protein
MVTLSIREHKVAFTKDISKFYQCVEADEAAQHVRRILWRFWDRAHHIRDHKGELWCPAGWMYSHSSCAGDSSQIRKRKRDSCLVPQELDICG